MDKGPFPQKIPGHSRSFPGILGHSRPFPAIPGTFPTISGHFPTIPDNSWPFLAIPCHSRLFPAISGNSWSFPGHFLPSPLGVIKGSLSALGFLQIYRNKRAQQRKFYTYIFSEQLFGENICLKFPQFGSFVAIDLKKPQSRK